MKNIIVLPNGEHTICTIKEKNVKGKDIHLVELPKYGNVEWRCRQKSFTI